MKKWFKNLFTNWGLKILSKKVNKMASKKKSVNTTGAAIAMIVIAVGTVAYALLDGDPSTEVDFKWLSAELIAAWGFFKAKDANATHSNNPTE